MQVQIPANSSIGAIVSGLEIPSIQTDVFQHIYELFLERSVVVFKQVDIDQEQHIEFSKRFGKLERTLSKRTNRPEISLLSNVTKDGRVAGPDDSLGLFLKGNRSWHTDSSFKVVGAKASLLRAVEVPETGGDTEWADMRAAWADLDPSRQSSLEGLIAIHSYHYSQGLIGGTDLLKSSEWDDLPPVEHPLVRIHPETGVKCLFLGRHICQIKGMSEAASQTLVDELTEAACQPPRGFRHQWNRGDVAVYSIVATRGRSTFQELCAERQ